MKFVPLFEFGYPLLYVQISDSWRFVNINPNAMIFHRHIDMYPDSYHKTFQTVNPI